MGVMNMIHGNMAFTANLDITYLAPTPVGEPIVARAWLERSDDRKQFVEATLHAGEVKIASAKGTLHHDRSRDVSRTTTHAGVAMAFRLRRHFRSTKVPRTITPSFWGLKILTTAMGEATSDYFVNRFDPRVVVVFAAIVFVGGALVAAASTDVYGP